jgi:hypothetical protein
MTLLPHRRLVAAVAFAGLAIGSSAVAQKPEMDEATLRVNMRKLWEDHVAWTRLYIVSATANLPDKGRPRSAC